MHALPSTDRCLASSIIMRITAGPKAVDLCALKNHPLKRNIEKSDVVKVQAGCTLSAKLDQFVHTL